jgi:two-component system sensor kinase FixL
MPEGGKVTINISADSKNGLVLIDIVDTGVGIVPEELSRITEPLYSTKARGMGLGLAISLAILEKNRGSLQMESELGVGSSFQVALTAS